MLETFMLANVLCAAKLKKRQMIEIIVTNYDCYYYYLLLLLLPSLLHTCRHHYQKKYNNNIHKYNYLSNIIWRTRWTQLVGLKHIYTLVYAIDQWELSTGAWHPAHIHMQIAMHFYTFVYVQFSNAFWCMCANAYSRCHWKRDTERESDNNRMAMTCVHTHAQIENTYREREKKEERKWFTTTTAYARLRVGMRYAK